MGKGTAVVVVLMAVFLMAVSVNVCRSSTDGLPDLDTPNAQDQSSDSWSGWLQGMYKEAYSSEQVDPIDAGKNLMESAENTAAKMKDTVHSAASGASKYTTEITGEAAANKAYERASDLKDVASDKADRVIQMVGANEGGETFEKATEYGKEKASSGYDATKQMMNTALEKGYEAKERMSDALSSGISCAVDAYDLHADWPSDDEDEEVENGRIRGSGTSYSKLDHYTQRMERKAAETDSDSDGDFKDHMMEGIDYGRTRISNSYNEAKKNINKVVHKAADAKDAVEKGLKHGKDGYNHLKDEVHKVHVASDEAKHKVNEASNKAKGVMGDEKRAFDESREKVGEAYESAKERMTGGAKATYENAKEKLSEATGVVGDKMRKDKAEEL